MSHGPCIIQKLSIKAFLITLISRPVSHITCCQVQGQSSERTETRSENRRESLSYLEEVTITPFQQ